MKPFSLLVKPSSADCNLRCRYCFYLDRCELYPETSTHRMSDEVLEAMVQTFMAVDQPNHSFGWQGGEPTLMGVEFFRKVNALQQQHGRPRAMVSNGLQTNGTLINDEFAGHLAAFNYLVGVSVDGPADVHDVNRPTAGGGGSHAAVMRGIETLKRHRVEYNILTLVNSQNVSRPVETYRYLCEMGVLFHQYIECVEFDPDGQLMPFAITGEQWGEFLCAIFDEWYSKDTRRVSIRLFDTILTLLVDQYANTCSAGRDCRQYLVVEYNGDVYPCDFYVREDLKLGNVLTDSWESMQASPIYEAFGCRKTQWHPKCDACEFVMLCAGDCPKNRLGHGSGDPRQLSALCSGWKRFYAHALPRFELLATEIRQERMEQERLARQQRVEALTSARDGAAGKVGRNDPCPCGSGRKFKKCCGRGG